MSNARLTDEELDEAFEYAHGSLRLTAALSELRQLRALDLTAYEAVITAAIQWRATIADDDCGVPIIHGTDSADGRLIAAVDDLDAKGGVT